MSQDLECGVEKEWNFLEDDDFVEDKGRSLPEDFVYMLRKRN